MFKGRSIFEKLLIITPCRLDCLKISIQEGRYENLYFCFDQTPFVDVEIRIVFLLLRDRSDTEDCICWPNTGCIHQLQICIRLRIYTQKFLSCFMFQSIQSVDDDWSALKSLHLLNLPATERHLLICFFRVDMYHLCVLNRLSFLFFPSLWFVFLILVFVFRFVLVQQRITNSVFVKFFLVN